MESCNIQINELPEAMTIQNEDWFLVNRGAISHKIKYEKKLKNQILDDCNHLVSS